VDSSELKLWVGWEVRGKQSDSSATAEAFVGSASDDPEAPTRYELIAVAARGFRPPRFLTSAPVADGAGLAGEGTDGGPGFEGLRSVWSLLYRSMAETGPQGEAPYAIYLLGVDPPVGASEEELASFNDFYTHVHLPEVAERRHALRAERFELVDAIRPPYQGPPRFLAVYEVDEEGASHRRHAGPPYRRGPDVWQRHTTPWRLWYRRLGRVER
jgi:hypothetical protein